MVQDNTDKNRSTAYKMLGIEALVTVLAVIVIYLLDDVETARSVAIGALAYIVPNAYFAKYVFRYSAAVSAEFAIRWFYVGEIVKIFATVLVFAMAFFWTKEMDVAALFATYIVMLVLNLWGNSILMSRSA